MTAPDLTPGMSYLADTDIPDQYRTSGPGSIIRGEPGEVGRRTSRCGAARRRWPRPR
jgi:hypothetical protein